jgi:hypothetical protein
MSKDKMVKLIESYDAELLENRFKVKISKFDNGVNALSYLIVTQDLLDGGFSVKYLKDKDSVTMFLKLLKLVN